MNMEPTHEAGHDSGIKELEQFKTFWALHGAKITVVAAVLAVAVVGSKLVRSHRAQSLADASAQLSAARSLDDLKAIVADYGSTPSAPLAALQLAKADYDAGDYSAAMTQYESFLDHYAKHELASVAELGQIQCREALGEVEVALVAFEAFASAHPDHFLAPQALLGQARCLEQRGRFDDARVVYENMVATRGDSAWGDNATQLLETMEDRREIYNNPPMVVAPVMPKIILPEGNTAPMDAAEPIMIPATQGTDQ